MRAIQVTTWGQSPKFTDSASTPTPPAADSNQVQVKIIASALHHLVRAQAAGKHYSTDPATTPVPYTPGADGVGTLPDGKLVYFSSIKNGGGFGEYVNLPKEAVIPIPMSGNGNDNDNDDKQKHELAIRIAALFNPAMSSYMALQTRTSPNTLKPNFTALIIGATSMSGQIAIKFLRQRGAKTIIGVARNTSTMSKLDIDVAVGLKDNPQPSDFTETLTNHKVDIILDYLYGPAALAIFTALPSNAVTAHDTGVDYIQIGSVMGLDIDLPGALLRSKNLTLRGAGPGSWSVTKDAATGFPALVAELCDDKQFALHQFDGVKVRKLEDADEAWADSRIRTVFVNE